MQIHQSLPIVEAGAALYGSWYDVFVNIGTLAHCMELVRCIWYMVHCMEAGAVYL